MLQCSATKHSPGNFISVLSQLQPLNFKVIFMSNLPHCSWQLAGKTAGCYSYFLASTPLWTFVLCFEQICSIICAIVLSIVTISCYFRLSVIKPLVKAGNRMIYTTQSHIYSFESARQICAAPLRKRTVQFSRHLGRPSVYILQVRQSSDSSEITKLRKQMIML